MNGKATTRGETRQRTVILAIIVVLLVVRFLTAEGYHALMNSVDSFRASDFRQFFYPAGERVLQKQSIYFSSREPLTSTGYIYSPVLALLFSMLARVPYDSALKAWFCINALCVLGAAAFFFLSCRMPSRTPIAGLLILITGFRFWPTTSNFIIGQANLPMLLLLCGAIWTAGNKRWMAAAVCLGVAAMLKTWAVGFLLFFILCRQWRGLFIAVATCAVGGALSFTTIGWWQFQDFLAATSIGAAQPWFIVSHSILGAARLHFSNNGIVHPLIDSRALRIGFIVTAYATVGGGCLLAFLTRPKGTVEDTSSRLAFACLTTLLISPVFHMEYGIFFLPALWILLVMHEDGIDPRLRGVLFATGVISYLAMTRGQPCYYVETMAFKPGWQTLRVSLCFITAFMLWGSMLVRIALPPRLGNDNDTSGV